MGFRKWGKVIVVDNSKEDIFFGILYHGCSIF